MVLAALLTVFSVAACSVSSGPDGTETTGSVTVTETIAPDTSYVPVGPVIDKSDKGDGTSFVIFWQGWWGYSPLDVTDVGIEQLTTEGFDVAAYDRDREIEDKLGIKLIVRSATECYDSIKTLQNDVLSGDSDVDLAILRSAVLGTAIGSGMLTDLDTRNLKYFDPGKPWWNSDSYETLSIVGTHYGVCGDFTFSDDLTVWALFFNKQLVSDYQLDNPYDLIKGDVWTYDKLFAMAAQVADDIDGVEGMTYDDRWGVTYLRDTVSGMIQSVGIKLGSKDEDGIPFLDFYNDLNISKVTKIYEQLYKTDICYNIHKNGGNEITVFTDGRALFTFGGMYYAPQMRSTDTDFGIIPYPKYDEKQEDYISSASPLFLTVLCTPLKTIGNNDALKGAFMELYSYIGYEKVRPEFYENLVTWKLTRDDESREMLPIIFDNVKYDVVDLFNFGDIAFKLIDMTIRDDLNFASSWAANKETAENAIKQLVEAVS